MTLDEPRNPHHAAALERGENPRGLIPESRAAERIAAVISPHLSPAWLTERCVRDIASKVVAHRDFCRVVFDEVDADPKRLAGPGTQLRQQQVASLDTVGAATGSSEHLEQELAVKREVVDVLLQPALPEHDPDEVADRQQDRKDAEISHDERAVDAMGKVS